MGQFISIYRAVYVAILACSACISFFALVVAPAMAGGGGDWPLKPVPMHDIHESVSLQCVNGLLPIAFVVISKPNEEGRTIHEILPVATIKARVQEYFDRLAISPVLGAHLPQQMPPIEIKVHRVGSRHFEADWQGALHISHLGLGYIASMQDELNDAALKFGPQLVTPLPATAHATTSTTESYEFIQDLLAALSRIRLLQSTPQSHAFTLVRSELLATRAWHDYNLAPTFGPTNAEQTNEQLLDGKVARVLVPYVSSLITDGNVHDFLYKLSKTRYLSTKNSFLNMNKFERRRYLAELNSKGDIFFDVVTRKISTPEELFDGLLNLSLAYVLGADHMVKTANTQDFLNDVKRRHLEALVHTEARFKDLVSLL